MKIKLLFLNLLIFAPQLVFAQLESQAQDQHVIVAKIQDRYRIVETFIPLDRSFKEQVFGEYPAFLQVAQKAITQNQLSSATINGKNYVCYTKSEFLNFLNGYAAQVVNPRIIKIEINNKKYFYPNLNSYQNQSVAVCLHSAYSIATPVVNPDLGGGQDTKTEEIVNPN